MHLPIIIQDLAIILIVAAAMTLLFRAIRQPVVLGYIVAGFLVGPNFEWIPTVIDTESIKVWAEIGVIFLLFALGLEFSFKKLARVGTAASLTAVVEVAGMIGLGFLVGKALGWGTIDSVFLGGILAVSSTTIIIRAFEELEMKTRGFVRLVFGVLIVEDLVAILLMVLLSTIAVGRTFSGMEMVEASLKLSFFLSLWFILGIFLIPSLLKRIRKFLRPETLLIVSLGLCFLMVVLATKVGFSPALGAFIMGSILAETIEGERIEHLIHPVKDLFGAVFFVSVGMMISLHILTEYFIPILIITLVTIGGKLITTMAGALLAGQSLRHSVQAGMSLAQIGEFSFIIAGLGLSLEVTSDFLYPIAISVSAVTTFTTPYFIRSADSLVHFLERRLPSTWLLTLERFRTNPVTLSRPDDWREFLKNYSLKIVTNAVVVIALFLIVSEFFQPWAANQGMDSSFVNGLCLVLVFALSIPFLWAIVGGKFRDKEANELWTARKTSGPLLLLQVFRWIFAVILTSALASRILAPGMAFLVSVLAILFTALWVPRCFKQVYLWFEGQFVINLNEKETHEVKRNGFPPLAPWDSHLVELNVSPDSSLVGKKLSELTIRERFGISIALIARGSKLIPAPGRNDVLYPSDILQVIGTDEQINRFRHECEAVSVNQGDLPLDFMYELRSLYIKPASSYANKTIRECGVREKTHGLVVGVEKKGQRKLNPGSEFVIEPGDVIWVVGDRNLMKDL